MAKNLESIVSSETNPNSGTSTGKYLKSVVWGQFIGLGLTALEALYGISNYIFPYVSSVGSTLRSAEKAVRAGLFNLGGDLSGFGAAWYGFNRKIYRGISGKLRFAKDYFNLTIRHAGSYLISYPIAIGASTYALATGLLSGFWALTVPYIIESVITGVGYILSTLGIRRKSSNPSYAPQLAYKPA